MAGTCPATTWRGLGDMSTGHIAEPTVSGRLASATPLVLPPKEIFDVEWPALARVERTDSLIDLGAELTELLDLQQQLPFDPFLIVVRQSCQLGNCEFKALDEGSTYNVARAGRSLSVRPHRTSSARVRRLAMKS
jgi:hypothetical protein